MCKKSNNIEIFSERVKKNEMFATFMDALLLGWSIEASKLENPRPQPRVSRVLEVEGSLFSKFRGSSRSRVTFSPNFEGFRVQGNP